MRQKIPTFLCVFAIFTFFLSCKCLAQTWQPLQMYGGGFITGLFLSENDTNTLIARCDVAGLFKTTDGGENWTNICAKIPKYNNLDLAVRSLVGSKNMDSLMYVCGDAPYNGYAKLWYTYNGGANWQFRNVPVSVNGNGYSRGAGESLWKHSQNPNVLILGGQPLFNYSTNQWSSTSGLYLSINAGQTWTNIAGTTFSAANISSIKSKPNNNDTLYISAVAEMVNGVSTTTKGLWKYVISSNTLIQLLTNEVWDFAFDAGNPNIIITTQSEGFQISTNAGNSWSALQKPFGYSYHSFVTAHPLEAGHWFLGSWTGLNNNAWLETTDAGTTFHETKFNSNPNKTKITYPPYLNTNQKPGFANANSTLLINPQHTHIAWCADWYGVWKSSNANQTLIASSLPNTSNLKWNWAFTSKGIHNLVGLRISKYPTDSLSFVVNIADQTYYKSINAGTSMVWDNNFYLNNSYSTVYAKKNSQKGYIVGKTYGSGGRIYKTTNGGLWFSNVSNFFAPANTINDIIVSDYSGDTLVCGIDKGGLTSNVYISYNGGASWSDFSQGLGIAPFKEWEGVSRMFADANNQTLYIWKNNLLYKRNYSDANWSLLSLPPSCTWIASVKPHPNKLNTLYLACYKDSLFKSENGGVSWTGIKTPSSAISGFAVSHKGALIVVEEGKESATRTEKFYFRNVGETTWQNLTDEGIIGKIADIEFLQEKTLLAWSRNTGAYRFVFPSAPLSVKFAHFSAKLFSNNEAELFWTTENELNNAYFEIEYSTNGIDFEYIGRMMGSGTSYSPTSYHFTHKYLTNGTNYYRLKQVDMDNTHTYSNIVSVEKSRNGAFEVFPNPFYYAISFVNPYPETITYEIVNIYGSAIYKGELAANAKIEIDTKEWAKGYYLLVCKGKSYTLNRKIQKLY